MKRVPFSVEIRIRDDCGKEVFKWRDGDGNLLLGLQVTESFVSEKLGIKREGKKSE